LGGITIDTVAPTITVTGETSNHANDPTLAKTGDIITANFTSTDTVVNATIGNKPAVITDLGNGSYKASYTVQANDSGATNLVVNAIDTAGNQATQTFTSAVTIDTTPASVSNFTGTAIDGYVQGATVFYDPTGTGVFVNGYATAHTDALGHFSLDLNGAVQTTSVGRIVVMGGVDAMTGQSVGELLAPVGFGVISPLSTIIALSGMSETALKANLGISNSVNLATFDPVAAMKTGATPAEIAQGELVFTKQQQIYSVIQSVAKLAAGPYGVDEVAL
jgi:hypothetical protein